LALIDKTLAFEDGCSTRPSPLEMEPCNLGIEQAQGAFQFLSKFLSFVLHQYIWIVFGQQLGLGRLPAPVQNILDSPFGQVS